MSGEADHAGKAWATIFEYSRTNRSRVLAVAVTMMAMVMFVELALVHLPALGYLYIIPLVVVAGFLKRWQVVVLAVACALLREAESLTPWSSDHLARTALVAIAFAGAALFVRELARNQQLALQSIQELKARQQLERQFLHAQRLEAVGRLAGGIAHDFNNLLSVIIGFSDLALQQIKADTPLWRDVKEIHGAADRAAGLTRQLLEFSRRDMLQPKVTDLNALISNLTNMLRRLIGEDVDLRLELAAGLSRVKVDPASIEQVVMNLVINARDAMPHGGRLSIRTAEIEINSPLPGAPPGIKPGRYVTLAVQDTGAGMDRRVQEHLFEPFFTTKEAGKGTGLGLCTVYGIVKQNCGDIWFLSEAGLGTTFTIYLPPTESAQLTALVAPRVRRRRQAPATVLLVEDDDRVRELAREILRRNGLTVIEASSPAEAIEISKRPSFSFDLLLTDVVMPEMSGPELAEKLAKEWPRLNVLFMTGYVDESVFPSDGRRMARALIQKPLSEDSLMQSVRAVLGQRIRAHEACDT
jgi:signal transduction histidine kinase/ActR/RegA family two-component response regulator